MYLVLLMLHFMFSAILSQIGELVEGIFQAGFWAAIVLVVIVVAAGYWLMKKFRK